MEEFTLTTRPDGKYDGDVRETKLYGDNICCLPPAISRRMPVVCEMFSMALDIIGAEKEAAAKTDPL